jgi:hypothetical protein
MDEKDFSEWKRENAFHPTIVNTCTKCNLNYSCVEGEGEGDCPSCERFFCGFCNSECRKEFGSKRCWFCTNEAKRKIFSSSEIIEFYHKKTGISPEEAQKEMRKEMLFEERETRKRKRGEKKMLIKRKSEEKRRREIDEHCKKCDVCKSLLK